MVSRPRPTKWGWGIYWGMVLIRPNILFLTVLCIFIYPGSINHNKVLDFITLDNYKANSHSFQLHWNLDHYKKGQGGVSVILEGLVAIRDPRTWSSIQFLVIGPTINIRKCYLIMVFFTISFIITLKLSFIRSQDNCRWRWHAPILQKHPTRRWMLWLAAILSTCK